MPTVLTRRVVKRSTCNVMTSFADDEGNPTTPSAPPTFTLTDGKGRVVNGREGVVLPIAQSVWISLFGDDTDLPDPADAYRECLVEAVYFDARDGITKPIRDYFSFYIQDSDK